MDYPKAWIFSPPADGEFITSRMPIEVPRAMFSLAIQIATVSSAGSWDGLESFGREVSKKNGKGYNGSSSESWAHSDVSSVFEAVENPVVLIAGFMDAARALSDELGQGLLTDPSPLNRILEEHGIGYLVSGNAIILRADSTSGAVQKPGHAEPPKLIEQAGEELANAWRRSGELLEEGKCREAVDSVWFVIESLPLFLRVGAPEPAKVPGKYFNEVLRSLRSTSPNEFRKHVLAMAGHMQDFLSDPTRGAVRHGMAPGKAPMEPHEARMLIEMAKDLALYLCAEYSRLPPSSKGGD